MKRRGPTELVPANGGVPLELVGPMTIALPSVALPSVTVQAAPPALITRRNAGHVGMTGNELLRVLREMRAEPRFRDAVIVRGKSFRAATPDAIVAFLRAVPDASTSNASEEEASRDDGVDTALLRAAGYELDPAASRARQVKNVAGGKRTVAA